MYYFAFFGTGQCDPNKDLKQFLAFVGLIVGWFIVSYLLRKIGALQGSKGLKIFLKSLVIALAVCGSVVLVLATWLGLACART